MAKKDTTQKKSILKKWWFWLIIIFVVGGIGANLGGNGDSATTSKKTTETKKKEDTKEDTKKEEPKKDTDTTLKTKFDTITLGDILNSGEGGSSYDSVVAEFGKPMTTSDYQLQGVTTKMASWAGLKGGDIMTSLVVMFSNDKAVNKAITGLKVPKHEKVTLEQFNAVPTDSTFTYDAAIAQFGEADSYSTSLVNGSTTTLVSWSKNTSGSIGSNFNMAFTDGVAISKANIGLE
ncbi:DUF3862 domain-containing protein [Carnobacterium gallinarum]|uniref:DUF3862 domain-containing protein n=1 Tax=Carnobacterium gallinarum TaxID=2749 RepID=UPI0005581A4C|nr:DUF3862 domain-containing protein [Carnobacterium gallinarum]